MAIGIRDIGWSTRVGVLFVLVLAIAPPVIASMEEPFFLDLLTRLIVVAIAAVSLNLILGYGGLVSFGHAAYLGIGAYSVGIAGYYDITDGWIHLALALGFSALFALITGAISLRTRGVHFIMITMAFAQMLFFVFVSLEEYGGDDGLSIYDRSTFPNLLDLEDTHVFYYVCFVSLLVAMYLKHRIVNSRFGMVLQGTKGNEQRMTALGFPTYRYQLAAYVIAGTICGYAGFLLGNFTYFISPEMMDWTRSGELIFAVVLGGSATIFGPLFGATVFILFEPVVSFLAPYLTIFVSEETASAIAVYWPLYFGALLVLVVLFVRGGISGLLSKSGAANG
jgi:branched-chain amino acid transport system permease protein